MSNMEPMPDPRDLHQYADSLESSAGHAQDLTDRDLREVLLPDDEQRDLYGDKLAGDPTLTAEDAQAILDGNPEHGLISEPYGRHGRHQKGYVSESVEAVDVNDVASANVVAGTAAPVMEAVAYEEHQENAIEAREVAGKSQAQIVLSRFLRHRGAMVSLAVLLSIVLLVFSSLGVWGIPGWWHLTHDEFNSVVNPQGAPTMEFRELRFPGLWYALAALIALALLAALISWLLSYFSGRTERAKFLSANTSEDGWVNYGGHRIVPTPKSDRLYNLASTLLKWAIIGAVATGLLYLLFHLSPGAHPFGQDNLGRDGFARVMRGTQTSLTVMFIIGLVATLIGVILGSISGFFRGHTDNVIMRFTDMVITIPTIVVGSILGVLVGGGNVPWLLGAIPRTILLALMLSLVTWTGIARQVRAQFLALREQEFVDAARVAGASNFRMMFKHILPNAVGVIIVNATLLMASAILLETALSYLGFGIRAPEVSLGQIINEYQAAFQTRPWLFWWPGLFIVAIALCINFICDGLRDAFDPRQRRIPTAKALARADAKKAAKQKIAAEPVAVVETTRVVTTE